MNSPPRVAFPLWGWGVFGAVVLALLLSDLFAHRGGREESRQSAIVWACIWISAGLLFNVFVWIAFDGQAAQEYLAAYLIEESLSLDNLFVFLVVFETLQVPEENQHRVLFWGIFGAAIFRGLFILVGVEVLARWHWVSFVLGATLLYAAVRVFRKDPTRRRDSRLLGWLDRHLPVTREIQGNRFIGREGGRHVATPLLLALITIELTDIAFAMDSVPAALSVSRSPFIIYTSNIFAVLGLRSLYVLLAKTIEGLRYLHYGLAGVLALAGLKLIAARWVHLSPLLSVGLIGLIIGAAVWASLRARNRAAPAAASACPQQEHS